MTRPTFNWQSLRIGKKSLYNLWITHCSKESVIDSEMIVDQLPTAHAQ